MQRATMAFALAAPDAAHWEVRRSGLDSARSVHTVFSIPGATTMKYWILACSALAVVAAHAVYTYNTRHRRRRGQYTHDQVSNEWLASAKIHEDHH